jgi:ABC-type antimicrobial peptide transport system permease subunit
MTLSVNERKKEIGIRKAIGAEDRDILFQFLVESVFITLLGGIIGILIGIIGSLIFLPLFKYPLVFPWGPIFISAFLTIIFGIIAGIYPAYKATKIDPIILLRQGF